MRCRLGRARASISRLWEKGHHVMLRDVNWAVKEGGRRSIGVWCIAHSAPTTLQFAIKLSSVSVSDALTWA